MGREAKDPKDVLRRWDGLRALIEDFGYDNQEVQALDGRRLHVLRVINEEQAPSCEESLNVP